MNKLSKTLLLLGMQAQCRADRDKDWQSLHKRDREWYLAQPPQGRWQLARRWVRRFAGPQPWILAIAPQIAALVGILLGVGLMSGLLQFQPQQRINLWWWLLLAVWLPVLWWLLGLWLGRYAAHGVWAHGLFSRLPPHWQIHDETPLLGLTARSLSQRFSLGFALGMVAAFFLYLLLTDLAFGWSSTLSVSAAGVHKLTQILSLPWRGIWPQAVPSLELVEGTRYFRVEEVASTGAEQLGQWWRFLLMNLLTYVLVPRILSLAWAEWQLGRAQRRLFAQDACIDGWWQRLHAEQVQQRAGPAPSNRRPSGAHPETARQADGTSAGAYLPVLQGIVVAGNWPAQQLASLIAQLPDVLRSLPQLTTEEASALTSPGQAFLLLCKGWEPPTGSLADLCQQLHEQRHKTYLWPAPLPDMNPERVRRLRESWQLFIAQLPPSCHLLEPKPDA